MQNSSRALAPLLVLVVSLAVATEAPGAPRPSFYQVAKLVAAEARGFDQVGWAVGLSVDTAVAGAPGTLDDTGTVYVFERDAVGGPTARLIASDAAPDALFGRSVDIDGDTVVVGAPGDDSFFATPGKLYVFERDAGGPDAWGEVALVHDGGFHDLGRAVAISGDRLVVSGEVVGEFGAAYVHERDAGGPGAWGRVAELGPDEFGSTLFGGDVAIDGDLAVVGDDFDGELAEFAGAVYVFELDASGTWTQAAKLFAADGGPFHQFGRAVAVSAETVAVGAEFDGEAAEQAGAVYVFERDAGGPGAWGQVAKILAPDANPDDQLGSEVDLSGDLLAASAAEVDLTAGRGAVYVFARDAGGAGAWGRLAKLRSADVSGGDDFGSGLALDGASIVAGARGEGEFPDAQAGAAYVFEAVSVDPALAVVGTCPGVVDLAASGLTPKGLLRVLGSPSEGDSELGAGPCVGTPLGLDSPRTLLQTRADPAGALAASPDLPEAVCGGFVQVIDETSCATTGVVQLP